jgi:AcrR family transcriptional regulator
MTPPGAPQRRSDARRNREAILAAAHDVLSRRPDAGLAEVARASGLTRTTVYAHFATREQLLEELVREAVAATVRAIDACDPASGPADQALLRVLAASWRQVSRRAALVETVARGLGLEGEELHAPVRERLRALLQRGRIEGTFRTDVPERWLLSVYFALVHAAGQELASGAGDARSAEQALGRTLLGAFAPPSDEEHQDAR